MMKHFCSALLFFFGYLKLRLDKREQSAKSRHLLILFKQRLMEENFIRRSQNSFEALSEELREYRKINNNLRRKIKEKDQRIQKLFSVIEGSNREGAFTPELVNNQKPYLRKAQNHLHLSEHVPREKENNSSINLEERNIFKQPSYSVVHPNQKEEIKLPVLDNRIKNIFQKEDWVLQNPERKVRVVRIPIERLKPLNSEQVKQRFLLKIRSNFQE